MPRKSSALCAPERAKEPPEERPAPLVAALAQLFGALSPEEAAGAPVARVRARFQHFLLPAAQRGGEMMEKDPDLLSGLGFSGAELRAGPERLRELVRARAVIAHCLAQLDRAVLFHKDRIAGRTRTLHKAISCRLEDPSLQEQRRSHLVSLSQPLRELFEAADAQKERRRKRTIAKKAARDKAVAERDAAREAVAKTRRR